MCVRLLLLRDQSQAPNSRERYHGYRGVTSQARSSISVWHFVSPSVSGHGRMYREGDGWCTTYLSTTRLHLSCAAPRGRMTGTREFTSAFVFTVEINYYWPIILKPYHHLIHRPSTCRYISSDVHRHSMYVCSMNLFHLIDADKYICIHL